MAKCRVVRYVLDVAQQAGDECKTILTTRRLKLPQVLFVGRLCPELSRDLEYLENRYTFPSKSARFPRIVEETSFSPGKSRGPIRPFTAVTRDQTPSGTPLNLNDSKLFSYRALPVRGLSGALESSRDGIRPRGLGSPLSGHTVASFVGYYALVVAHSRPIEHRNSES
jgi:hypothetical protein